MKKVLALALAGVIVSFLVACGPSNNSQENPTTDPAIEVTATDPAESTPTPAPQTQAVVPSAEITDAPEASDAQSAAISLDDLCATIKSILDDGGYSGVDVTHEGETITVNVWLDGLCMELTLAQESGNDSYQETWDTIKDNFVDLSESIGNLVDTIGHTDVYVTVNILNDLNRDNVLLSVFEGIVIFDVMD